TRFGQVRCRQHTEDTRGLAGSARVHTLDDRMRVRAADEKRKGGIFQFYVIQIAAAAGHQPDVFFPPDRLSDSEFHALNSVQGASATSGWYPEGRRLMGLLAR